MRNYGHGTSALALHCNWLALTFCGVEFDNIHAERDLFNKFFVVVTGDSVDSDDV